MKEQDVSVSHYEQMYRKGYGLTYPDSHIIRIHRHILEWELHLKPGPIFDFGCGTGTHLKYFLDHGYTPYGCDTSATAIQKCKSLMPEHSAHFFVTPPESPDLLSLVGKTRFRLFLSNQVLYFLDDAGIRDIVRQAYAMLGHRGAFVATMLSYHSLYLRHVIGRRGDFRKVEMKLPRLHETMCVNFKDRSQLEPLFKPFRKLHVGYYGSELREDEGPAHHWSYVGVKD